MKIVRVIGISAGFSAIIVVIGFYIWSVCALCEYSVGYVWYKHKVKFYAKEFLEKKFPVENGKHNRSNVFLNYRYPGYSSEIIKDYFTYRKVDRKRRITYKRAKKVINNFDYDIELDKENTNKYRRAVEKLVSSLNKINTDDTNKKAIDICKPKVEESFQKFKSSFDSKFSLKGMSIDPKSVNEFVCYQLVESMNDWRDELSQAKNFRCAILRGFIEYIGIGTSIGLYMGFSIELFKGDLFGEVTTALPIISGFISGFIYSTKTGYFGPKIKENTKLYIMLMLGVFVVLTIVIFFFFEEDRV